MTESPYPRVPEDAAVAIRDVQDLRETADAQKSGVIARAVADVEGHGTTKVALHADGLGMVIVRGSKSSGGDRGVLAPDDIRHDLSLQGRLIAQFGEALKGRFLRQLTRDELRELRRQRYVEDRLMRELEALDPVKAGFLRAAASFYDERLRTNHVAARLASARAVFGIALGSPAPGADPFGGITVPDDPTMSTADRALAVIAALRATSDVADEGRP
ncbi:MAG: hypothetical protein JWO85_2252 [Candidatus Eremiobacteraeota bacterium]|nr:hypothetical protein [Candidatus Eremiobacteraeota bacterium]